MKIVWERSIYIGNAPVFCTICGYRYYPRRTPGQQLLLAIIYDDDDVVHGEACRDCVAAGPLGIKTKLEDRIKSLQDKIDELQTLAQNPIEPPTLEEEFQVHLEEGG